MKKISLFVLMLGVIIVLSSCGKKEDSVEEPIEIQKIYTSYTLDELLKAKLPDGYCMTKYKDDDIVVKVCGKYPNAVNLYMLIPEVMDLDINTFKVISSGEEDGMIYTLCEATSYVGNEVSEILFINDPITMEFVAGSITDSNYTENTHYLFYY